MTGLLCALLLTPGQAPPRPNLYFETGTLEGWQGGGFSLLERQPREVTSRDASGGAGQLHYTFRVPSIGGMLRCSAYAVRPQELAGNPRLDVFVVTSDGKR